MKNGDIVRLISLNKECLLVDIGLDLETKKNKCFVIDKENNNYIVEESDIIFVSTLEDELEQMVEEREAALA